MGTVPVIRAQSIVVLGPHHAIEMHLGREGYAANVSMSWRSLMESEVEVVVKEQLQLIRRQRSGAFSVGRADLLYLQVVENPYSVVDFQNYLACLCGLKRIQKCNHFKPYRDRFLHYINACHSE
jgi:hypothetical protein